MMFVVNGFALFLYAGSYALYQVAEIALPLNIAGVAMLWFVIPYNLSSLLPWRFRSTFDKLLAYPVLYFFLYVPVYYVFHRSFGLSFDTNTIIIINLIIIAISQLFDALRVSARKTRKHYRVPNYRDIWTGLREHAVLWIGIASYGTVHGAHFLFYRFIPEWDSYPHLLQIEHILEAGVLDITYRGFFILSTTLLSSFGAINPYVIFSFWLVILQATTVIALYGFIRLYAIRSKVISVGIMLAAISVPVVNMEIDMIRPQNLFIAFMPVYLYFLFRALKMKEPISWIISSIIVVGGLNHHEFFVFLLLAHIGWIMWMIFYAYILHPKSIKDRIIFALGITSLVLSVLYARHAIRFVRYAFGVGENITGRVIAAASDPEQWQWWFLGKYQTDGDHLPMGWPDIEGAIKYYGYSIGPFAIIICALFVASVMKKSFPFRDKLAISTMFLFAVFAVFAEILPRLGLFLLPERFWILLSLLLFVLAVPLWKSFEESMRGKIRTVFIACVFVAILVGVSGSIYIASAKKSNVSMNEYRAAQWMKENTDSDALFLTQDANFAMVSYFARRTMSVPPEEFFLGDTVANDSPEYQKEKIQESIDAEHKKIRDRTRNFNKYDEDDIDDFIAFVSKSRKNIADLEQQLRHIEEDDEDSEVYILYSEDKFDTLYTTREWWMRANFYGANLDKFYEEYPIVYEDNGVYIWRMK